MKTLQRTFLKLCSAVLLLALTACASQTQLARKVEVGKQDINLQDKRSPESKAAKNGPVFTALRFLADDRFSPRALDLFQSELLKVASVAQLPKPIEIEVTEFQVIDHYPALAAASVPFPGSIPAVISEMLADKAARESDFLKSMNLPRDKDYLLCVFVGRVNGKAVKLLTNDTYSVSKWAGLVYNDPDYQRALQGTVKKAAEEAARQLAAADK